MSGSLLYITGRFFSAVILYGMTTPSHVHLDLDVRNDDVETVSSPPPLNFDETRLHPFLNGDASDYFCTIARVRNLEQHTGVNPRDRHRSDEPASERQ